MATAFDIQKESITQTEPHAVSMAAGRPNRHTFGHVILDRSAPVLDDRLWQRSETFVWEGGGYVLPGMIFANPFKGAIATPALAVLGGAAAPNLPELPRAGPRRLGKRDFEVHSLSATPCDDPVLA